MTEATRPPNTLGLRHVALFVAKLPECVEFYTKLLGMHIEWQPDEDNFYLSSGHDNLALHRAPGGAGTAQGPGRLDHIGFILSEMDDVDRWHDFLQGHGVRILAAPKTHRDGARSCYVEDPDGVVVQLIYHPPLSNQ